MARKVDEKRYKFPKKQISFVRERYQITIPEKVRKEILWVEAQTPVEVSIVDEDSVLIRRYKQTEVNWDKIWKDLKDVRREVQSGISLSKLVAKDRKKRR